ncbi:MAG: hypothetical protein ABR501_03115 [Pyrinomonadaceae bacterium]
MLITVSGLDGSGKSTVVDWLKESLENENQRVAVSHMNYDVGVYPAIRFLIAKTTRRHNGCSEGSSSAQHRPRKLEHEGRWRTAVANLRYKLIWNKGLRSLIYPLDVLIFILYRAYIEKLNRQILIMDRYFYDTLVDVAEGRHLTGLRFLSWLTPTPDLSVYLDVSAEKAFARKNEYSVAYLNRRRLSYQKLTRDLPGILVIPTDQDVDATRLRLTSAVRERMVAQ